MGQVLLARHRADAEFDAIDLVVLALPVADREGDEVARHFGRRCELNGVLVAGARRVGDDLVVRDGGVILVDNGDDVKGRLVSRSSKLGKATRASVASIWVTAYLRPL